MGRDEDANEGRWLVSWSASMLVGRSAFYCFGYQLWCYTCSLLFFNFSCYLLFCVVQLQFYFALVLFGYYVLFWFYLLSVVLSLHLFLLCFWLEPRVYQKQPLYLTSKVRSAYTLPSLTPLCYDKLDMLLLYNIGRMIQETLVLGFDCQLSPYTHDFVN